MYTLYARAGSGSVVCEAMLTLIGAPCHIETVARGADGCLAPAFRRLNPMGQVPALRLPDGSLMTESAAITLHLADLHPAAGLAPALTSPLRPAYLRWMLFLATAIYTSDLRLYCPARYTDDPAGAAAVKASAERQMEREFEIYAAALGKGPFILGEMLSAVDIYAAMLSTWNPDAQAFFKQHPNMKAAYDRVAALPGIKAVWERNGMPVNIEDRGK